MVVVSSVVVVVSSVVVVGAVVVSSVVVSGFCLPSRPVAVSHLSGSRARPEQLLGPGDHRLANLRVGLVGPAA